MSQFIRGLFHIFGMLLFLFMPFTGCVEKPMVVIIPSYNNAHWVENNLISVFKQNYENYKVIYVDDCSTDDTYERVVKLVAKYNQHDRFTLIHNEVRCGAMANWYTTIHSCNDNDIIVQLDGDDWLAHDNVLSYLNNVYTNKDIWLTYGQFVEYPSGAVGYEYSKPFSEDVILNNTFRKVKQLPMSHLRTFYAWLFKSIKLEDVLYQGNFYPMTCDKVIMACCVEMAARHHYCVPDVLYVYNNRNQLSDHRVNAELQHSLAWYVLSLSPYKQLDAPRMADEFDEFDCASLILFCQSKPQPESIANISRRLNPLKNIFIFWPDEYGQSSCSDNSNITFVPYSPSDFIDHFKNCLGKIQSRYVFLGTEDLLKKNFDLPTGIKLLNKTGVDLFYWACAADEKLLELIYQQKLPKVFFEYPVYAFYAKNIKCSVPIMFINGSLWKKQSLIESQKVYRAKSSSELGAVLNEYMIQQDKLGLLSDVTGV